MHNKDKIRNVAIIAHIDHGKTTLLDALLKQSQLFRDNEELPERVMDSYDQERERGITIFAKITSLLFGDHTINIVDTPGHADFASEVERVLGMVNGVLLVVDAKEGPKPQTRFVLSKALKIGLKPLVVFNKIDRPQADPDRVLNEIFDLFVELGANDEQLDFVYCYASALKGFAQRNLSQQSDDMQPLLQMIVDHTPAPEGESEAPFVMQATQISYDSFIGRQVCGRVLQGSIKKGAQIRRIDTTGSITTNHSITHLQGFLGLNKHPLETAHVGQIISLAGIPEVQIGDTICAVEWTTPLPPIAIEEPTVSIDISVNDGPFVGASGKQVTFNKIKERLVNERRHNVSYRIEEVDERTMRLAGRGELHLAILLEAMRREGYEFCVAKPRVITKTVDGQLHEPISRVYIEVPEAFAGTIIEQLSQRRAEMQHLHTDEQGITKLEFLIPVRGLVGYRNEFLTSTKGLGILTSTFDRYEPWRGTIIGRRRGVLVSMSQGKASAYAIFNLEDRGSLFIDAGEEVYEGMIVGEHNRENDLIVNVCKAKQLTNVRAAGSDEKLLLTPPQRFHLETAIGYLNDDELLEVTPDSLRLRKRWLTEVERNRNKNRSAKNN